MNQQQPNPNQVYIDVGNAVEELPSRLSKFLAATTLAMCNDPLVMSLSLGSVFVGVATRRITVGVATFWLLMALLRTISGISNAVGAGLTNVATAQRAGQQPPPVA